jgi:hypothetical protein
VGAVLYAVCRSGTPIRIGIRMFHRRASLRDTPVRVLVHPRHFNRSDDAGCRIAWLFSPCVKCTDRDSYLAILELNGSRVLWVVFEISEKCASAVGEVSVRVRLVR